MNQFENKVVVITGGNSGIGLATAQKFKAAGARVITNARNEQRKTETLASHAELFDAVLVADVADLAQQDQFYSAIQSQFGQIDVLFLNAGVAFFEPIESYAEQTFDTHFDVNVKGLFFGIQKAIPLLAEGASILVTTSISNSLALPGSSAYAATKAAVRSLVKTIGAELAPRKIRVNAVSPGPIETPIYSKMPVSDEERNQLAGSILESTPAGRFGKAEEIAETVYHIASNDYIYGTEIVVDGGMLHH